MLQREFSRFYIDGAWQTPDSKERFDVVSPATGKIIGHVPKASTADIDRAVEAARRAFYETDWKGRPVEERAQMCERLAALLAKHQPEFRDLIVDEMGCTHFLADVYQSAAPALHWNYYAAVGRKTRFAEVRESDLTPLAGSAGGTIIKYANKSLVVQEPVGVVAVLCAYNFALPGIAQKTAPALMAGCTVVVKVPEQDPLAIFAMADLVTEAGFPPGVINIVAADAKSSKHLVEHRHVDMVSFTGSTEVGKLIGRACAEQIKPCVLELGGKSAAILLDDADVDALVPVLVGISVGTNSGQSCVCMSRFIVPRARYDEIAAKLVVAFQSLKIGDPHEPDTVISPLITQAHRDRVLELIRKGVAEGATIATGGRIPESPATGWYLEPTLLTGVRNDMTVAQEEFFGPVVVLIAHDGVDDAVRIANDSRYGLAGCVFTGDPVRGFDVARRIRTGIFSVNTFAADFNSPFGGFKQSGIGREHGPGAIEEYLLPRTITVSPDTDFPPQVVAGVERVAPPF
jgi:betaine-aldehyde dehydrogenase